jgi:hypothetical protein
MSGDMRSFQVSAPGTLTRPAPMLFLGCQSDQDRALGIGEGGHPPGIEDVEGLGQQARAELGGARRARVDVLDGDVAVPVRGNALVLALPEPGDVVPVHLRHGVDGVVADGDVRIGPAQEVAVEALGASRSSVCRSDQLKVPPVDGSCVRPCGRRYQRRRNLDVKIMRRRERARARAAARRSARC